VKNLVTVIESAGGVAFKFPFGTSDIDAISQWPDGSPPLFFINSSVDADRARFSLAHELGHMVMHQQMTETAEEEANRFAAEFLMPAKDIRQDLYGMSIERASNLKPFWRVSMAAIIKRSYDLGCMTKDRYASMFGCLSRLGFRRREPNPIATEEPKLVQKLVEAHVQQKNFSKKDFARMLHIYENEVEEMYFRPSGGLRLAI
jgi:Zn-dependent peptidase ImmA (M78 family)